MTATSPTPSASPPELKPPWQTPAAAAGAVAAGLVVGRKGLAGLALGMAAVAGARWLLGRKEKVWELSHKSLHPQTDAPPTLEGTASALVAPQKDDIPTAVVASLPPLTLSKTEESSSVLVFEQAPEMPSRSALPGGNVWFALFSEAPIVNVGAPQLGPAPDGEVAEDATEENGPEPLAAALFNEAPDQEAILDELEAVEAASRTAPEMPVVLSEFELERVESPPAVSDLAPADLPVPAPVLQVVAKAPAAEVERVPRPARATPRKRQPGELPKSWIVPAPESETRLLPKKSSPPNAAVHRSIVPHEMLHTAKAPRRWPLIAAVMVLLLALLAVLAVGTGMDHGLVNGWKTRWLGAPLGSPTVSEGDMGLWSREGARTAALSPVHH